MKTETLAYLAGFFDGEGCINISKYRRNDRNNHKEYSFLRIQASNLDITPLNLFKNTFGCGSFHQDKRSGCWAWASTSTVKNKEVLRMLLPFLLVKREAAKEALEWLSPSRRLENSGA